MTKQTRNPTPREIREACERIRDERTDKQRAREQEPTEPWRAPVVSTRWVPIDWEDDG